MCPVLYYSFIIPYSEPIWLEEKLISSFPFMQLLTMGKKKAPAHSISHNKDSFRDVFGFSTADVSSLWAFVRLLCRPADPACLGVIRFLFGKLYINKKDDQLPCFQPSVTMNINQPVY